MVPGFAVSELHLTGNELLCYSLIYGFSQDGVSEFSGSLSYIASMLNIERSTARRVIERLVAAGVVLKRDTVVNGVRTCFYRAAVGGCRQNATGVGKMPTPYGQNDNTPNGPENDVAAVEKKGEEAHAEDAALMALAPAMREVVTRWLSYKREKRQTYTPTGLRVFIKRLTDMSGGDARVAAAIVEQSMAANYAGVFPLRKAMGGADTRTYEQRLVEDYGRGMPLGCIITETEEERNRKYEETLDDVLRRTADEDARRFMDGGEGW